MQINSFPSHLDGPLKLLPLFFTSFGTCTAATLKNDENKRKKKQNSDPR